MIEFLNIPLSAITESNFNPRKSFNPVKLQELADSIKTSGVHQPILVRPLPGGRVIDTDRGVAYEIVAGARRFRASLQAGLETVPAIVSQLDDSAAIQAAIIENLQRDSLTELETAEGYKTLMEHNNLTAEQVGQKVSKSRSSVYGSLKLLDLWPFAKQSLRDELITSSAALLIARISDVTLQKKALDYAESKDEDGHSPSIRALQKWLRENVMLDLSKAPFPIALVSLTPAGSCNNCDKRTGANPDLFTDVKSADVCTHPPCYHIKAAAHKDALAALAAKAESKKERNANVDNQQGLGLESTLAQDARAQQSHDRSVDQLKHDIESIKAQSIKTTAAITRIAIFDALKDHIKSTQNEHAHDLIAITMLRAWLVEFIDWQYEDCIGDILDITLDPNINSEHDAICDLQKHAVLRIQAASEADIYRYMALSFLIEERVVASHKVLDPTPFYDGFSIDQGIDLDVIRKVAAEDAEEELKTKIAAINKQIKAKKGETAAPKTTSTPPPAGAAIDVGEADAKKQKPAPLRKAKTSAQEAISGIAAAMQGLGSEPLDASLGGSELAAVDSGKLIEGAKVKVLDGKHLDKQGSVTKEIGSDMWNVELLSSVGLPFAVFLPTKSLQVIA